MDTENNIINSKDSFGGWFEEFSPGQIFKHWPGKTITEMDNHLFSLLTMNDNPLHTDEIFTTQVAGYPSVFAHGMLSMGLTGTMLTNYVGDGALTKYGVRFTNQVWPGDTLTSTATIIDIREQDGERVVDLQIETTNQNDIAVITGNATAKIES